MVTVKDRYWDELGVGPWGIRIRGTFAGWGGLQPFKGGDTEIGLVLLPEFWGWGKRIILKLVEYAFGQLKLPHVIVALLRHVAARADFCGWVSVGSTRRKLKAIYLLSTG